MFCLDQVPLQGCTLRWLRKAFGKHGHDGCCSEYFFSLLLGDGKDSLEVSRKLDWSRPSYRTWLMHTLLWQHEDCNWSWPLLKLISTNPLKFCFLTISTNQLCGSHTNLIQTPTRCFSFTYLPIVLSTPIPLPEFVYVFK